MSGLDTVYTLGTAADAEDFYDGWAAGYDSELAENGYVTPKRCAEILATHAADPAAPLAEFGCGTGLGGVALRAAGFTNLFGYDISTQMLDQARGKGVYQALETLDLAQDLDLPADKFQNVAAIGMLNPNFMPPTVIDQMLNLLPVGGHMVFSINDHSAKDGSMETRVLELTEHNVADLLVKDYGDHLPGVDLLSTVYLLQKR